jgi:carbonic anhydrase/acetyltransferase-like protein (isoleucine patch superfamily)
MSARPSPRLRPRNVRRRHAIIVAVLRAFGSSIPRVHPTAFIDPSAQVIGDAEIGEESSVWMNAVIRGDVNWIRIGRRTNIQDGSVVHVMADKYPTSVGDDVTVGHSVILHGCTVEDRCLIGMGAILLNGARVGTGSIVAAGTLLTEGTVIPPGSLVMGLPGRVKRPLSTDEIDRIAESAADYVSYRLHYQAR